ncbi:MAG: M15 family metallopeptidase [Acidimicrobiia bacterium]
MLPRYLRLLVVLGLLAASCGGQSAAVPAPTSLPRVNTSVVPVTTTPAAKSANTLATTTTVPPVEDTAFVVWMPDGLHPDFDQLALDVPGVTGVTIIEVATLHIAETRKAGGRIVDQPPRRFVIPAQGVVLEASTYGRFVDEDAALVIGSLASDEVLLGESSAEIRRLAAGDHIVFEGGFEGRVAAVLPDEMLGSAELVVATDGLAVPRSQRSYALVDFDGSVEELEVLLNDTVPGSSTVRVRDRSGASGRRPTVRSQLFIKQTFGEFAYRPTSGGRFVIDPDWVDANIATENLPLLGRTTCHRIYVDLLHEVMQSLVDDGLGSVIDRSAFQGCWVSRYMRGSARLSRHSWGVAADINFGNSRSGGPGSPVNEELLNRMAAVGIASGHLWTNPDPGHFEYYGLDSDPPTLTLATTS